MDDDAPIELFGFHPEYGVIFARRLGEPSFVWVQDVGDAYQAAASRRVEVVATPKFRDELLATGISPRELQAVRIV